jgi:hypothetical protein
VVLLGSAVSLSFLFVRFYNEFQMIIMNSMGHVNYAFRSALSALPLSIITIYFASKNYGVLGAFFGLNVFYLSTLLQNTYYLKNKFNIPINVFFNFKEVFESVWLCLSISVFLILINNMLNIYSFAIFWLITLGIYLFKFYKSYKNYAANI